MKDLIPKDVSRCNNDRCPTRVYCARYRQLRYDFENYRAENNVSTPIADKVLASVPVSRFNGDVKNGLCDYFLNAEVE